MTLLYHKLDRGRYRWPRNRSEALELSRQQLRWLLEGLEINQKCSIYKAQKEEDGCISVKSAIAPVSFIPHSFATPSLIAFVGYQKYQMGVPNYRLEKHFERKGILISRACMSSWLIWVSENILFIVFEILHQLIKQRLIVNADESVAPVNKITELEPLADENGSPLKVVADVDYVEIRNECEAESADETDDTDEEKNSALKDRKAVLIECSRRAMCKIVCNRQEKYAVS